MRLSPLRSAALLGLALAALSASAQNLVADGDFEQAMGTLDGYTPYSAGSAFDGDWTVGTSSDGTFGDFGVDKAGGTVIDGTTSVRLDTASISQTLTTVVGQSYTISFDAYGPVFDPPLAVGFGTSTFSLSVPSNSTFDPPSPVAQYSLVVTATDASTLLSFTASSGAIELDDVTVTPQAAPEPASLAAFVLGASGFVARRRRRTLR